MWAFFKWQLIRLDEQKSNQKGILALPSTPQILTLVSGNQITL